MKEYNFKEIEKKWQSEWVKSDIYRAQDFSDKKKFYCLVEFPYPSGDGLHVGHAFSMTGADVYARKKRMSGYNVLFPMGWDAFGLPTENYAIKHGIHPAVATKNNTDRFRDQMQGMGFSFDWKREVNTTDPDYYKWTQWIFIKLFEHGLAYKEERPINWCPSCKIGLANEEVIDGNCERCGASTHKRNISQWIVKITDYADRLLDGLKQTNFIEKVKAAQINWIDRSEGAEVDFEVENSDKKLRVFTTRPDTLWGATFMVVAPEHELVATLMDNDEIKDYVIASRKKSELERAELQKEKTGVFTGLYAINPVNKKKIPIWISDFVLATYGTGAIMSVPAHDKRDFDFAKKYDLPIIPVIMPNGEWDFDKEPYTDVNKGKMANSDFLNDKVPQEAIVDIINWLVEKGQGERSVNYHLRDWIFSRQHYWGEPIPMIHCEKCGWVPVDESQLPIKLPEVEKYEPTDTGESPLANIADWVNTSCPKCGGKAKRETDTMPNWAGSDWYFLRYLDPENDDAIVDMEKMKYWMPVDVYVGGDEHNTLHLLYSRFIYQFLWDIKAVPEDIAEPYYRRMSHGVILGADGARMSKSRGNVVIPDIYVDKHGSDVLRMYMMFMGSFEGTIAWNEDALKGVERFINRMWNMFAGNIIAEESSEQVSLAVNKAINKVGADMDNFSFNTAIAALMELLNEIEGKSISRSDALKVIQMIAPITPFISEELWQILGGEGSVHLSIWPQVDEKLLDSVKIEIPVQINGKVRGKISISKGMVEEDIKKLALENENVAKALGEASIKKFIYVNEKIVTFVV